MSLHPRKKMPGNYKPLITHPHEDGSCHTHAGLCGSVHTHRQEWERYTSNTGRREGERARDRDTDVREGERQNRISKTNPRRNMQVNTS